jgi:hypothetical protein
MITRKVRTLGTKIETSSRDASVDVTRFRPVHEIWLSSLSTTPLAHGSLKWNTHTLGDFGSQFLIFIG